MSTNLEYEGIFYTNETDNQVNDQLAIESPLEISINDTPFTVVMQTPGNELELSLGLLYAEDVIKSDTAYQHILDKDKINFSINPKDIREGVLSSRSLLSVSSCGICGKKELKDMFSGPFGSTKQQILEEELGVENLKIYNKLQQFNNWKGLQTRLPFLLEIR